MDLTFKLLLLLVFIGVAADTLQQIFGSSSTPWIEDFDWPDSGYGWLIDTGEPVQDFEWPMPFNVLDHRQIYGD